MNLPDFNNNFFSAILNSISEGVFTVDKNFKITSFNKAAEKITGFKKNEAIGKLCYEIFRTNICFENCALKKTLKTSKAINNFELNLLSKNNKEIPVKINTAILKDNNNNFIGGVETFKDISLIKKLNKELNDKYSFEDIIGKSKEMQKIFNILPEISKSDVTILICGKSGTGKELFAAAIHNLSSRNKNKFIKINCASIPEHLLESEMFGYKKGAFTDAKNDKKGLFESADNGSLFLDEIGDLPLNLQAKLLRVIQEKEFTPLGSTVSLRSNVRIIAATNRNLEEMVRQKLFREDLFFRLNVMKIDIPTLKDRAGDILLLTNNFINKFNLKYNKNILKIDKPVLNLLLNYDYPGNVRELENIIEHSIILSKKNLLELNVLPEYLKKSDIHISQPKNLKTSLDKLKADKIMAVLKKNNFNKLKAAEELNVNRTTLWRWIKKYNTL